MPAKKRTIDRIYPTQRARQLADEAVDALPNHLPMNEYIRVWEHTYLSNGGIVKL